MFMISKKRKCQKSNIHINLLIYGFNPKYREEVGHYAFRTTFFKWLNKGTTKWHLL